MIALNLEDRVSWWVAALIVLFAIPLLPILVVAAVAGAILYLIYAICLRLVLWGWWSARGLDVLFIYSDSPIWRDYLEQHVLPHLRHRALVLNWSERKHWRLSLATIAFRHFGGRYEFNPMAVVVRPFRRTRTFRFWKPFRALKKGNLQPLQQMQKDFFQLIGVTL